MTESMRGAVPDDDALRVAPVPSRWSRRPRPLRWLSGRMPESRADRLLIIATLTAVIIVGGATIGIVNSEPGGARMEDEPTLDAAAFLTTTTTTLPPTTTTTGALPAARTAPEAPPPNPRAKVPIVKIGEIQIPRIGLVHAVYEGVTLTVIDKGPGHWPGSAVPGQLGNAVFAGHRTTKSRPFRRINEMAPGDEIIFKTDSGTHTYKMNGFKIVTPKDVHIVNPTPDATVTLFACHPPGSARQRYVVTGSYVSSTPV